jgi:hypothetical protein
LASLRELAVTPAHDVYFWDPELAFIGLLARTDMRQGAGLQLVSQAAIS